MIRNRGLNHQEPAGKLIAAPAVQVGESPASWIQNLCASHQYSATRLESILDVRPRFHDWDLRVDLFELQFTLERAGRSPTEVAQMFSSFQSISRALSSDVFNALRRGPPKYCWCPACLDEDERPYLRWWWRLPSSTFCTRHQRPLVSRCANCQSELVLSYALMVNAGHRTPIFDLSYCQECGLPRLFAASLEASNFQEQGDGWGAIQAAIRTRAGRVARFGRWGRDRFLIDDFLLAVGPRGRGARPSLLINAATFETDSKTNASFGRAPWSSLIERKNIATRRKLAYALRLVHAEMFAKRQLKDQDPS